MGQIFLKEGIVERNTAVADSAIMPCKKVWHKSDMKKGCIPVSGGYGCLPGPLLSSPAIWRAAMSTSLRISDIVPDISLSCASSYCAQSVDFFCLHT
jgi:hypothetical protein